MQKVLIYTDGACSGNPGPGGFGAIVSYSDQAYELGGYEPQTTNNRMEMMAAIAALESLKGRLDQGTHVILYTDSVYVIRGMTQWIFGWMRRGWKNAEGQEVTNRDLWIRLNDVVKLFRVDWRFIRGHKGIAGNERCDEIAVAFSHKESIFLYQGTKAEYSFDLDQLPQAEPLPEFKSQGGGSKEAKSPAWYLSLISGKVTKYSTWKDCEAAVKGRPGVKFKKVTSQSEEDELLKNWGIK